MRGMWFRCFFSAATLYRIRVARARKIYKHASTAEDLPRAPELCAPDQWPHLATLAFIVVDQVLVQQVPDFNLRVAHKLALCRKETSWRRSERRIKLGNRRPCRIESCSAENSFEPIMRFTCELCVLIVWRLRSPNRKGNFCWLLLLLLHNTLRRAGSTSNLRRQPLPFLRGLMRVQLSRLEIRHSLQTIKLFLLEDVLPVRAKLPRFCEESPQRPRRQQ